MRVSNEDRSPFAINGCHTAPTPTGRAEIVGNDFRVLHEMDCASFALHTAMTSDMKRAQMRRATTFTGPPVLY